MDEQTQEAYNEWLLNYGYRPVTFLEAYCGGQIRFVAVLKRQNAMTEIFNHEQFIHNYTLRKLTKE